MRVLRLLCLLALAALTVAVPVAAQGEVTISLAVNAFLEDIFKERIVPAFEAQNPGIKVHLVVTDTFGLPLNPNDTVEDYLDDAADYLTGADVVEIDSGILRELTRAGYLLDLSPLADTDASLNAGDYYPAALDALRWDGGLWALPVTVDAIQVYYDRQAFDEAGLGYPNGNWTAADYANAVRALTELDATGTPTEIAVELFGESQDYFFASFAGDVLDDSVLPNVPDYSNPVLYEVADEWVRLNEENYFAPPSQGGGAVAIGPDMEPTPLIVGRSSRASVGNEYLDRVGAAPLPGNQSVVTASGYGVSSGTRHPDAAYTLVKFLSGSAEAAGINFAGRPARRSIEPVDAFSGEDGGVRIQMMGGYSAETEAAIESALENGRPASDFAFASGVYEAMQLVLDGSTSFEAALQQVEGEILTDLTAAENRRAAPLVVDAPPAPVVLAAGEVALNFAVSTFTNPLPNAALWDQLAAEFSAQDPQVGVVTVSGELPFGPGGAADLSEFDCYVTSDNPVTGGNVLDTILSLDPLLQSDTTFNPNDLYAGVLAQLQRDGMTWGVPITLTVEALEYDPALFEAAGVPAPVNGWTVSDFELALRLIQEYSGETPFVASALNTTYLSTLIAAYGGVPYDTSTTPATLNFDDPSSVAAIQQVLDLVLAGYITYEPFTGGRGGFSFSDTSESAITTATVGTGGGLGGGRMMVAIAIGPGGDDEQEAPVRYYAPYPTGTSLNGASYGLVAGYVSADTANVEPCYRWLRFVSQHPELFEGMPVSRTLTADPALDVAAGAENAAFYRGYGALLDNASTRIIDAIPTNFGIPGESYWLLKAFDAYIAAEGDYDLATALSEAEAMALEFRECTGGVDLLNAALGGPGGGGQGDLQEMAQMLVNCAISVDPSSEGAFQFGN